MRHNFKVIEKKWQKKWEEQQAFKAVDGRCLKHRTSQTRRNSTD